MKEAAALHKLPRTFRGVALAAALLLGPLAACSTTTESSSPKVDIAPGVSLRLPDHQPFGDNANAIQLVQAIYQDRSETFQAIISSHDGGMSLVMTMPNGPRIMSFDWHGEKLAAKFETIAPKGLSAEHMLADIITIYAPADLLGAALVGGELVVQPDGTREIQQAGKPVIRVTYPGGSSSHPWNGRAVLENLTFTYRLEINSRPLPQ